jgi:hypothetical protein
MLVMPRPNKGVRSKKKIYYASSYYQKKKETYGMKVFCECGCIVRRMGLIQHRKSGIHRLRLELIEGIDETTESESESESESENSENE